MTRPVLLVPLVAALSQPVLAQDAAPLPADDGFSLIEEGAKLVLRGLMTEMEPALDEMETALREMEPMLRDLGPRAAELMALMGDMAQYQAPEVLPNGDILIRRKPGAPAVPDAPAPVAPPSPPHVDL